MPIVRRRSVLFALAAIAALLLAACGSGSSSSGTTTTVTPPAGGTLEGSWNLASYTGPTGSVAATGDATMAFAADGTFTGNTGCNVLNGTYTTSGDDLTVTPGPMTLRACVDPAGQAQEDALVAGLPLVTTFAIAGEELTLTDADGNALFVFAAGAAGLEGSSWTVTGVNNGREALVGTPDGAGLTLEFGADGTVGGSDGCNSFSGPYTSDGDTLSISTELATTLIGCEPAVSELAEQYLTALQAAATFEISGSMLTLRDTDGAMQVTAARA